MDATDGEVYEKHADELVRFATVLVGPSGADDLVAAAVLRVFSSRAWPTVVERRAYLYRAVLNEARQSRRQASRRLRREARAARGELAEAPLVRAEVLDALRRLSVRQRAVVFFTYWLDLDATAIGEVLEVSPRTVQRELRSARQSLEALLS